jgi:hypothetical protein
MTIDVLGTGESLHLYDYSPNIRIGVNDIGRYVDVDYLVVLNSMDSFSDEKKEIIATTVCKKFYTQLDDWCFHESYTRITLQKSFPIGIADIESKELPKSIFSPYVAVALAYKSGADRIRIFGVDMVNHNLSDRKEQIKKHWQILKMALEIKGVKVKVFGNGILTKK